MSVNAGIPVASPAFTINKVCGSGLKAVQLAAQAVLCGDADIVVAGGAENMSQAPYVVQNQRWGSRMGDSKVVDTMLRDGLTDGFEGFHMGVTAENVAEQYGITREDQDNFAVQSQKRAVAAIEAGRFKEEIVPVEIPHVVESLLYLIQMSSQEKMLHLMDFLNFVQYSRKMVL